MCVKLPPGDLNPGPYPTSIYTGGVTTTPKVCGGQCVKIEQQGKWETQTNSIFFISFFIYR